MRDTQQSVVVDRIEGGWAVLEVDAAVTFSVPASWLPTDAKAGDVLAVAVESHDQASALSFKLDQAGQLFMPSARGEG